MLRTFSALTECQSLRNIYKLTIRTTCQGTLFLAIFTLKQEQATGNKPNGNSREGRTTARIIF